MISSRLLADGMAAVAAFGLLVTVLIVGMRLLRAITRRRRERAAEPLRALLLDALCADDDDSAEALRSLSTLGERRWRTLEPTARAMLAKVSGQARSSLVELFERRGIADRALADLRSIRLVKRGRAAEVLGQLRYRPAAPALCRLLTDRDVEVRLVAVRALGRVGDLTVIPALLACLHGPRSVPPAAVVRALTGFGPGAQDLTAAGLSDPVPLVRAVAIEVLGATGAVQWTPRIATALVDDPHPEVQIRAARALGALGMPEGVDPLLEAIDVGRPEALRIVAAGALGSLGTADVAPVMVKLLDDPVHRLGATAGQALLQLGDAGRAELEAAVNGFLGDRAAAQARAVLAEAAVRGDVARPREADAEP
ncbi:HEAT repeat domain-containing protein [Streptomyces kaniharaensis]|uniref:HEAT repeat domain-containing protein n=1 Tax=Streptomyces kaniharaensis TaxID=212423 RepID=A0A6N7KY13_9ACTN|nr:HEAT repeat domain-containing protein [Streptomyces kaniharaensis]MQS15449.1 HEAT repeat domain-containing protein [Streptomyces kaniharaensis]